MNSELIRAAERCRDQLIQHPPLAGDAGVMLQGLKLAEESGELAQAMLGVFGANPRKGFSHTRDDVLKEAVDVILTATVLGVWVEGGPAFAARLAERLEFLTERLEQ